MTKPIAITGARIFDGDAWHEGKVLVIDAGKITGIVAPDAAPAEAEIVDAAGQIVVPGFIDLQVNGGGGVLLNERPDVDGIAAIAAAHAKFGTTALLPTLITDTREIRTAAIRAGREARARGVPGFIGLHLEGPHLSIARKGVHDPALIRPMDEADLDEILACKGEFDALMITVAPESTTPEQVSALADAGFIVSLGHTDADCATANRYFGAGARTVTHLFNAMSPLGHREPGVVGAALDNPDVHAGLIADGFHVDPVAMGIALRAKNGPGRIFLVTDAMSTIGTDDTGFLLNGRQIYRKGGRLTLADGTLAGADIDMLSSVRFVHERLGLPFEEAVRMATVYAADAVGLGDRKGHIRPGYDADFVLLTGALEMGSTWIGGQRVFSA